MEDSLRNSESNVANHSEDESADPKQMTSDSSSVDESVRERVLKEVGSTSSTFIGPAFRAGTVAVKSDIEDALSEFYKELEKTDSTDGIHVSPEEDTGVHHPPKPLENSTSKDIHDTGLGNSHNLARSLETDVCQKSIGQRRPPWPHWYQNEPYHHGRPNMDVIPGNAAPIQNQWRPPPPFKRPPHPRFHKPPYSRPPPPPSAFPCPQDLLPHMNHNWRGSGMTNQYNNKLHFPPACRFPPPNECSNLSQDFYGDAPQHSDRDRWGYDTDSNVNVGWSSHANEGWSQQDFDWQHRLDAKNESCEQEDHHKLYNKAYDYDFSLVLILMRGLPGSGKTTRAKELLSSGPSGLILSTDDYFAHKDGYVYDPSLLGVAHEWNQRRAKEAMNKGHSPVIVDNTNIQAWEMKPYIKMALERGYTVHFHEPDTSWKFDPFELEKRNKHGVPQEKISQMLDRFSCPISVDIVMSSQEPPHVSLRHRKQQRRSNSRDFY